MPTPHKQESRIIQILRKQKHFLTDFLEYNKWMASDGLMPEKDSTEYEALRKLIQIDQKSPFFKERRQEYVNYYQLSWSDLVKTYIKYSFPTSRRYKKNMNNIFEERMKNGELDLAYKETAPLYILRLLLAYDRIKMLTPYFTAIQNHIGKDFKGINVLDYGCGTSDIGLLFAALGADVTIVELEDKVGFAEWRYDQRGYKVDSIKVMKTTEYPKLEEQRYNIVFASEILEHVTDPLKLVKSFVDCMQYDAILFNSVDNFEKKLEGDHLKEALLIGKSGTYQQFYRSHFLPIATEGEGAYLFRKI